LLFEKAALMCRAGQDRLGKANDVASVRDFITIFSALV